jgi:hypothetical protein
MATSARPNFFLLLDLDPDATWDQTLFEKILREKRIEWSRQSSGVARKALVARQNLALISSIQQVMADQSLRAKEAAVARNERAAARRAAYMQFEKQLALLNAKDVVGQEEVDRFIDAFKHLYPPAEIRARLQVQIALDEASYEKKAVPELDAAVARAIADRLDFLHLHTLYELLQLSTRTSTAALAYAAEQLYTHLVVLQPTAETSAKMELAGLARDVFKSDEMRARYDAYLRMESLSRLLKELAESVSRSTNQEIHPGQVSLFLEQARKEGWTAQEALDRLKEYARQHKWIMMIPTSATQTDTLLCPNCQHLNQAHQHYCTTCQQPLYIACPICGILSSCECMACGHCAFPIGNCYLVDKLLAEIEECLHQGDGESVREALQQAEQAWPAQADARALQIASYQTAIQTLLNMQQQARIDAVELLGRLTFCEDTTESQSGVRISWQPSRNGAVVILRSTQPLHLEGQVLSATQIDQHGQRLDTYSNFAIDSWRPGELIYYTPVLLLYQQAYFGPSQGYVCAENVRQPAYQHLGSVLRLRWDWPQDCQEVLLSYHTEAWPEHHVPPATTMLLERVQYEQRGHHDLPVTTHRDHYILITALKKLGEEQFQASGTRLLARLTSKIVITYEIKKTTRLGKQHTLHLIAEPHTALPMLLLVSKQGGLPLRKADGTIFQRIKATLAESRHLAINLSSAALPANTFGKLFFEDDTVYGEFTIHHPDERQMRLS